MLAGGLAGGCPDPVTGPEDQREGSLSLVLMNQLGLHLSCSSRHWSSNGVPLGIFSFELQSQARPGQVGPQAAALRCRSAVEEHVLDPVMIVEILQVAH